MDWILNLIQHLASPIAWSTPLAYIILAILVSILVISLFGKLGWTSKFFKFGIGKDKVTRTKKRTCMDCIRILLGKTSKYQMKRDQIQNSVLKNQMTFAELKIKEVELYLVQDYRHSLFSRRTAETNLQLEQKEFLIYQEALANACELIKTEVRRSFKENGFHTLSGTEYSTYVKSKVENLISVGREYLMTRYPFDGMTISLDERFKMLDKSKINNEIFDMYNRAKEIMKDADKDILELDTKYEKEINEFIGE